MATQTIHDRMLALASTNMTKAKASVVAEQLEDVKQDMEELGELITEFVDAAEMWADDEADRESRAEAKESVDTLVNQMMGEFAVLVDKIYGEKTAYGITGL